MSDHYYLFELTVWSETQFQLMPIVRVQRIFSTLTLSVESQE